MDFRPNEIANLFFYINDWICLDFVFKLWRWVAVGELSFLLNDNAALAIVLPNLR